MHTLRASVGPCETGTNEWPLPLPTQSQQVRWQAMEDV